MRGRDDYAAFWYAQHGKSLVDAVRELRDAATGSSLIDFGLHATLCDPHEQLNSISSVAQSGVRTFKLFLAYAAQGWMSDDFALARVMQQVGSVGGLLLAHCENGPAIDVLEHQAAADGRADQPASLNAIRPALLEAEAVNRVITFGEIFNCPVFIVHVTSREALEVVRRARARGAAVAAETCPQYLALTAQAVEDWACWRRSVHRCERIVTANHCGPACVIGASRRLDLIMFRRRHRIFAAEDSVTVDLARRRLRPCYPLSTTQVSHRVESRRPGSLS